MMTRTMTAHLNGIIRDDQTMCLYERMKKYAVKADSIENFLQRYTKRDRHEGRGPEYVAARIKSHKEDVEKYGYTLISHHDSNTGDAVTWYPPAID